MIGFGAHHHPKAVPRVGVVLFGRYSFVDEMRFGIYLSLILGGFWAQFESPDGIQVGLKSIKQPMDFYIAPGTALGREETAPREPKSDRRGSTGKGRGGPKLPQGWGDSVIFGKACV